MIIRIIKRKLSLNYSVYFNSNLFSIRTSVCLNLYAYTENWGEPVSTCQRNLDASSTKTKTRTPLPLNLNGTNIAMAFPPFALNIGVVTQ